MKDSTIYTDVNADSEHKKKTRKKRGKKQGNTYENNVTRPRSKDKSNADKTEKQQDASGNGLPNDIDKENERHCQVIMQAYDDIARDLHDDHEEFPSNNNEDQLSIPEANEPVDLIDFHDSNRPPQPPPTILNSIYIY